MMLGYLTFSKPNLPGWPGQLFDKQMIRRNSGGLNNLYLYEKAFCNIHRDTIAPYRVCGRGGPIPALGACFR